MHCCYLHPIVPLSLRYMQVTFYPYAPAGLYRSAIIAMQLCKNKTISDAGGKIPPNFKVFFLLSVALYPVWLPCDTTPN